MKITLNSRNSFSDFIVHDLISCADLKTTQKVVLLEKAVEMYKKTREVKMSAHDLNQSINQKIEKLTKSLEGIEELLKIKEALISALKKYGIIAENPNLNIEVDQQKNLKIIQIVNLLKNLGHILLSSANRINNEKRIDGKGYILIPIILSTPFFASIFFVLNRYQVAYIILGLAITLINTILFILLNKINIHLVYEFNLDCNNKSFTFDEFEKKIKVNNKFFLDAAWVDALQFELRKIDAAIKTTLFGKTPEEVNQDIEKYRRQIEENEKKLNKLLDTAITADEYLNIRRKLDILNLEKDENESSEVMDNKIEIVGIQNLEERTRATIMEYLKYISNLFEIKIL